MRASGSMPFVSKPVIINNRKYPKFVETINNRYKMYNNELKKIRSLEEENKIFVIRPSELIKIKRVEKDSNEIQEMYDLGKRDSNKLLKDLYKYIREEK